MVFIRRGRGPSIPPGRGGDPFGGFEVKRGTTLTEAAPDTWTFTKTDVPSTLTTEGILFEAQCPRNEMMGIGQVGPLAPGERPYSMLQIQVKDDAVTTPAEIPGTTPVTIYAVIGSTPHPIWNGTYQQINNLTETDWTKLTPVKENRLLKEGDKFRVSINLKGQTLTGTGTKTKVDSSTFKLLLTNVTRYVRAG